VFPAPDANPDEDDAPKRSKKDAAAAKPAAPKAAEPKGSKDAKPAAKGKGDNPDAPKKRKTKKKKTSNGALVGIVSVGGVMLVGMIAVLIWFFTRTPQSVEMLYYAPADAQFATGINMGHTQKFLGFYKAVNSTWVSADYKIAADAVAKVAGVEKGDDLLDYVVKAESLSGNQSIILRTKAEFDADALAKLPSAAKQSLDGRTFYLSPILPGGVRARVFAPTKRLVVVCSERTDEAAFRKILTGHADDRDKTLGVRMGELGKRVTRGTFWTLVLFGGESKPPPPPKTAAGAGGANEVKAQYEQTVSDGLGAAQGYGVKASLGSRELRVELDIWYKDGDKAHEFAKKWKESELAKGDDGNPPKWFKEETQRMGDSKVAAQLLANIKFGASGEVFYARSGVETADLIQGGSRFLGKIMGPNQQAGAGGQPPGPRGPGGPGAPGPGLPAPKGPRRRAPGRVKR
jgi:hypothetical protein